MEAPVRYLPSTLLVLVLHSTAALGQTPPSPLARADLTASIGSFGAFRIDATQYEYRRWTHTLFAGIGGGFYWTDHLKTEVEVASGGHGETSASAPAGVPESPTARVYEEHAYRDTAVSIAQSYQFGRNARFHPFVAAGARIEREHHEIDRPAQSVNVYGPG